MASSLPSSNESDLEELENSAICNSVKKKRKSQSKYSNKDLYKIAKCTSQHGPYQVARLFKSKYSNIRKSTVREFLKKYYEHIDASKGCNCSPKKRVVNLN